MQITKLRTTCTDCKHVFDADVVTDAPIAVAAASMEAIRCPECGSADCGLGGNYDDAPPVTAPLTDRVTWWKTRGERGTSSNTIFHAFGADARPKRDNIPLDPDDFRRCHQLLALFPEWRATLSTVADVYPYWKPFVSKWAEMEALFAEEFPSGHAPKLYELMQILRAEASKILAESL